MNTAFTVCATTAATPNQLVQPRQPPSSPVKDQFIVFNPRNSRHCKELKQWCQANWDSTFKKSLEQSNPVYYHDCCTCFSRRGFCKISSHPALQTSSIQRMPSFKMVNSGDQFYRWLLGIFLINTSRGQRCYFPAINRYHVEEEIIEKDVVDEEAISLKKRVEEVYNKISEHNKKIAELEMVNQQLLASSKSWHQRYIDLLEKQESHFPVELQTPFKKKTKYFEVLDLY